MKSYLLLRDNLQSGPYTLDEIRHKELHPLDLVWIEGTSTCWMYPQEVEELKMFVKPGRKSSGRKNNQKSKQPEAVTTTNIPQPESELLSLTSSIAIANANASAGFQSYNPYQETDRDLFQDFKSPVSVKTRYGLRSNLVALMIVVIGVAMTAFVVKNIVESFGHQPLSSGEATQIESINYESEHAALASQPVKAQAAVIKEAVLPATIAEDPVEKTEVKPVVIEEPKRTVKTEAIPDPVVENKSSKLEDDKDNAVASTTVEDKKEAEPKETPKKDVKSLLNVSANDYKVGVLGGVSNLQIRVSNSSSSTVDATVEVLFYKPNGSVVNKETVQVSNITPGGSKSVSVPASSRGVKVSYRILDANAG